MPFWNIAKPVWWSTRIINLNDRNITADYVGKCWLEKEYGGTFLGDDFASLY